MSEIDALPKPRADLANEPDYSDTAQKIKEVDREIKRVQYKAKQLLVTQKEKYENLYLNLANNIHLFEDTQHLFKLECGGYEGPITFHIKKTYKMNADIRVYLSMKHKEPDAKHNTASFVNKSIFKFSHPEGRHFNEDECLYICLISEMGC